MKEIIKNLIGGVIGVMIFLGIFWILANVMNFLEQHFWLIIPFAILDIYLIFKEISKNA